MACLRFLEVNDGYTTEECSQKVFFRYYAIDDNENSFSLSPWNDGIKWCNINHQGKKIISNTGRIIDYFFFTSINFSRIVKAKSKPPASLIPYSDNINECECPPNNCQIDCASEPNGFCCVSHSFADRLSQIIKN